MLKSQQSNFQVLPNTHMRCFIVLHTVSYKGLTQIDIHTKFIKVFTCVANFIEPFGKGTVYVTTTQSILNSVSVIPIPY